MEVKDEFNIECIFAMVGPESVEEQQKQCGVKFDDKDQGVFLTLSNAAQSLIHGERSMLNSLLTPIDYVQQKQFTTLEGVGSTFCVWLVAYL